MTSMTLAQIETVYGVNHLDHLDKEATVPTVMRLAPQGDIIVIRRDNAAAATTPIPTAGFPVVRGENGGNTHAVFGAGFFDSRVASATNLTLGTLTVPAGADVMLDHPEHGAFLIAPGTYEIRRQREQADELRLVAD